MTTEEQSNLELAKRYEDKYNSDIDAFVRECYTEDCELPALTVSGKTMRGHEKFIKLERRVLSAAPKRKMRVDRKYAKGDTVVVEAVLLDPDKGAEWQLPFCAVLVCRGGKIAIDRTYADFSKWPGF